MRPHTGSYCSVQTVGRGLPKSFGSSCAVMVRVVVDACGTAASTGGGARMASAADPAHIALRMTVIANTPLQIADRRVDQGEASISAVHPVHDKQNCRQQADAGVPRKTLPDGLELRRLESCSLSRLVAVSVVGQSR